MERLDVVDEQDKPIGQTTDKATAHAEGLIHRIVAVYVFDQAGRLYVQHHAKSGLLDHSVGGHVAAGESYDEAAAREAAEELGLSESLTKVGTYLADERLWQGSAMRHMQGLYETWPQHWQFHPNEEVQVITPMYLGEIVRLMDENPKQFTPGFILSMQQYIQLKDLPLDLVIPKLYSL